MNLVDAVGMGQLKDDIPEFEPGDTIAVHTRIVEGETERIQIFEGVCISRRGSAGVDSAFTVRKVTDGFGVERVFPLHSPRIAQIDVTRTGRVRRSKLYYLRGLKGKRATRIAEKRPQVRKGTDSDES